MASLRSRVLVSVLALSAAGLVALASVTYAEQRSFLEGNVDKQAGEAIGAVSRALDLKGCFPGATQTSESETQQLEQQGGNAGSGQAQGQPGEGQGNQPGNLIPPGTYGQRRESSGKVICKAVEFNFGENKPSAPDLPARIPTGKAFTVNAVGDNGPQYRVLAHQDPEDSGITVVAVPLHQVSQQLSHLVLVEALVIAGVLAALGLSAFFVVRIGLRPLDRMEVTAGAIAGGDLSRRVSPATSRTEVGRLGLALNEMLDRLEQAFAQRTASEERLRRFLADASHELRTPLASIRGYAELFRMGATEDREGTELAMRRIEEESRRMGVLVEDLLTLARLDEAPELRSELVDMSELARDAVMDARATAPERLISLQAPAGANLLGDSHQLRQVLANLLRNALVHTPEGTAIEVGVEQRDGHVRLTVRDHGPGLPAGSAQTLFNRFWRAEGGREKGKAGAGLGLAIAHGVVERHHGTIAAGDAPGGGALFEVVLPLRQRDAGAAPPASQSSSGA